MQTKITPCKGGGKFEYLTPEISLIEIAVEKGFAGSGRILEDVTYDDSWQNANNPE